MILIEELQALLEESFEKKYSYIYPLTLDKQLSLVKDEDEQLFVVKCVSFEFMNQNKINVLLKLNHPRISPVIEYIIHEQDYLIVKPFVQGKTLFDLVEEIDVAFDKAVSITMQLIEALKYLYKREDMIVFRDLQPKNIIVDDNYQVTLIDTETIREYKVEKGSDTVVLGTLGFIAPEQYGFYQTTDKADMYSLGIILYYILKGDIPKYHNNFLNIDDVDNIDMKELINTMTQFDPDKRYDNINQVEEKLKEILNPVNKVKNSRYYVVGIVLVLVVGLAFTQLYLTNNPIKEESTMTQSEIVIESIDDSVDQTIVEIEYTYFDETVIKPIIIEEISGAIWQDIVFDLNSKAEDNISNLNCQFYEENNKINLKFDYTLKKKQALFTFFAGDFPGITTRYENLLVVGDNHFIIQIDKELLRNFIMEQSINMEKTLVFNLSGLDQDFMYLDLVQFFDDMLEVEIEEDDDEDG